MKRRKYTLNNLGWFSFNVSSKAKKCQERIQSSCIVYSGHLTKSPPQQKFISCSWMKRYFVLHDTTGKNVVLKDDEEPAKCLYYYKNRHDDNSHKCIKLENAQVCEGAPVNNFQWVINLKTQDRLYYLCAASEGEHQSWLQALKKTIEGDQEEERLDSIDQFMCPESPGQKETFKPNYSLQDELDRMKLQRADEQLGNIELDSDREMSTKFRTPSGSNKDSGIEEPSFEEGSKTFSSEIHETLDKLNLSSSERHSVGTMSTTSNGDEYVNTSDLSLNPSSSNTAINIYPEDEELYGNVEDIMDLHSPKSNRLSSPTDDCPPQQQFIEEENYDTLSSRISQSGPVDDDDDQIYDCPPSSKPQQQFIEEDNYDTLPSKISQSGPVDDDDNQIYDCPPSSKPQQQFIEEDNYDTLPSRISQSGPVDDDDDQIYDCPPSSKPQQQFIEEDNYDILPSRISQSGPADNDDDQIYDCPPSSKPQQQFIEEDNYDTLPSRISQSGPVDDDDDQIYDCPPSSKPQQQFIEEDNYDILPSRISQSGPADNDDDQIYDCPPSSKPQQQFIEEDNYDILPSRISQSCPADNDDQIYDCPPSSKPRQQFIEEDNYDTLPSRISQSGPADDDDDQIYDCPPSSKPQQQFIEEDNYDILPSRTSQSDSPADNNGDQVYECPPLQYNNSEYNISYYDMNKSKENSPFERSPICKKKSIKNDNTLPRYINCQPGIHEEDTYGNLSDNTAYDENENVTQFTKPLPEIPCDSDDFVYKKPLPLPPSRNDYLRDDQTSTTDESHSPRYSPQLPIRATTLPEREKKNDLQHSSNDPRRASSYPKTANQSKYNVSNENHCSEMYPPSLNIGHSTSSTSLHPSPRNQQAKQNNSSTEKVFKTFNFNG